MSYYLPPLVIGPPPPAQASEPKLRARVSEEEASQLLSGFWNGTDLMSVFVEILGFERARKAWRIWLDATVDWSDDETIFAGFVDCFEVQS